MAAPGGKLNGVAAAREQNGGIIGTLYLDSERAAGHAALPVRHREAKGVGEGLPNGQCLYGVIGIVQCVGIATIAGDIDRTVLTRDRCACTRHADGECIGDRSCNDTRDAQGITAWVA